MAVLSRPIPPLYTVYILRSSVNHASLYIGSTPNPPRRLKQHNGEVKGGAVRTSRNKLRPWEMVALVSGFPSAVAALKFEWAVTNPHLSMHIPSPARISIFTQRKKNGQPRRPRASMTSIMSNLHLLLGVPSFARWPLRLHFFNRDAHTAWEKWCATTKEPMRSGVPILTDFGRDSSRTATSIANDKESESHAAEPSPWGVHALPLDYAPIKDYVAKGRDVFSFEREGDCVICNEHMPPDEGLYGLCSNNGCEGVGHLSCWSRHMLSEQEDESIIPVGGRCPKCHGPVKWGDMMTELTLRLRGAKDVDKLLKKKRKAKAKA
ncbi:hypothetical protein CONLIGDRAFT_632406 [Coniochaeta ligniaria NRRL 30616]|uniref:GIY-YIG domain-containing protein n=1 Tax=Coniochaeta ligniaria NRRL 30616 TaxID=1408157 RepID=A0A1J7JKH8_9PEZI|nr:hypothetical protein CONLIGDRAFT_632406 [Coniochaeta ligniaria NRRL 30616]